MRKRFFAGASVVALVSTAVIATAIPANAEYYEIESLLQPTDVPVISWKIQPESPDICDAPTTSLAYFPVGSSDQVPVDSAPVVIDDSPTGGTIDVSNFAAGDYDLEITCKSVNPDQEFDTFHFRFSLARYTVEKSVEGDAPADAVFGFEATAVPGGELGGDPVTFKFDLAAGESKTFYDFDVTNWSVEEVDDGGALEVRADNNEFTSEAAEEFIATITNVFPATEPAPEPNPEPTDQPEDEKPATSAKAKPSFTG